MIIITSVAVLIVNIRIILVSIKKNNLLLTVIVGVVSIAVLRFII
ncbi:hypothetical protein CLOBL_42250 [Clostridium sp. BL-8]|nr:hypothetical protein CLOBL_42250 [Clostridium sp. BL-8]